ncbi:hypothetical protein HPB49_004689 [Dermacentor silvarum]|uniref:Uncharacterized protein n=1 Tax=Dermacentor silvarum TaxID=543639 RepID=A0ACB8DUH7_DERSI|nr:hypothetical protein HPB49_004689 [Dermacentor silvarum]
MGIDVAIGIPVNLLLHCCTSTFSEESPATKTLSSMLHPRRLLEGSKDGVSCVSSNVAIDNVLPENRDHVLKPRNTADERVSNSCVGHRSSLFPKAKCDLLVVVGVKATGTQRYPMQAPCSVQGLRHQRVVSRGTGRFLMICREDIASAINRNQGVVICGETGSGKTTQPAQFIFEDNIRGGQGSRCHIVVTQPRRIATIFMAKRVALERDAERSDTVGFRVHLTKQLLRSRGGALFCTWGILLRHLQQNVELQGVSHVFVDEVHEPDVCTDLLLALLREELSINRTRKMILTSATINTAKFSELLDGAPVIMIPGKAPDPVTECILDNLVLENIVCGADLVRSVPEALTYIMEMKPPGAILCFLPGWNKINKVGAEDRKRAPANFHDWILPLHSRLRYQGQQKIFANPPADVRKAILSTNLAETFINVNDVEYVVDSRVRREQRINPSTGVSLLGTFPTSKATVNQRAGRVGCVQPRESYHVLTQKEFLSWDQFKSPEMQTTGITRVVLDCKHSILNYQFKVNSILDIGM